MHTFALQTHSRSLQVWNWGSKWNKMLLASVIGDVAQMVERMLSMHEAQGSIPCFSTFFFNVSFLEEKNQKKSALTVDRTRDL